MRNKWRAELGVLTGASALVLSAVTASPVAADETPPATARGDEGPPPGWREVEMPPGTKIAEGVAPARDAPLPDVKAAAAAAAAGPPSSCLGATAAYGAGGCFVPYGDIFWVGDLRKDGMSAAVGIYTDYGRAPDVCLNKNGVNTWVTCNKDYREDGNVRLQVWRYDSGTGKFYQPEAWSSWIPVDGQY
ncbi:hypothetical protein AB0904_07600 [Streptomyces sp. NPDC006684]|uniref:hypothetical protein n=1 Tax=Streptomyces sp. NPDC006684 TaxID=3154477 RepID=UPI0034532314